MNEVSDLAEGLRDIFAYEVARGNVVVRADRPAGSRCPLAVIFARPLDFAGYGAQHSLSSTISTWQNHDAHYPLEAGYVCERTRQALAGPIQ